LPAAMHVNNEGLATESDGPVILVILSTPSNAQEIHKSVKSFKQLENLKILFKETSELLLV